MTRYIDADALAKFIDYGHLNNPDEKLYSENDIREMIDMMPTITEPVRHGKWIKADSQQYFRKHYPAFTCSECGQRKDNQKIWNYCPHCGARMDLE